MGERERNHVSRRNYRDGMAELFFGKLVTKCPQVLYLGSSSTHGFAGLFNRGVGTVLKAICILPKSLNDIHSYSPNWPPRHDSNVRTLLLRWSGISRQTLVH